VSGFLGIEGDFAYSFTLGMVAAVNPCGFAMLPAYLSFFLESEQAVDDAGDARERSNVRSVTRALVVSGSVASGFLAVFLVLGVIINAGASEVYRYANYVTVVIGAALFVLGVAMMFGYRLPVTVPKLDKGGRTRSIGSMVLFGVSYAIASLGCTLVVFIPVVVRSFSRRGFSSGLATFVMYALGMALVLMALTIALALARRGLLKVLRTVMRYVDHIASVVLVLAGAYFVYYGIYEIRAANGQTGGGGLAARINSTQNKVLNWMQDRGPVTLGLVLGAIVGTAVIVVVMRRRTTDHPAGTRP
jgi:cytochrome c-type biogenesis protein